MEMNHNGNKLMKNPVGTGVWLAFRDERAADI